MFLLILNFSQIDPSRVEVSDTVCQVDEERPDMDELDELDLDEDDFEEGEFEEDEFSDVVWSVEPIVNPGWAIAEPELELELPESSKSLCTKSIIFIVV